MLRNVTTANGVPNLTDFGQLFAEKSPDEFHCAFLAHPVFESPIPH